MASSMALVLLYYYLNNYVVLARGYSKEVQFALYGNITSFDDLFALADLIVNSTTNDTRKMNEKVNIDEMLAEDQNFDYSNLNLDGSESNETGHDHAEFVKINKSLKNITRRLSEYEHDDSFWGLMFEEPKKLAALRKLTLQFLMHSKHEMAKAFDQRLDFKDDKRYKIGYLFNKCRRIKTEQMKLIFTVHQRRNNEKYFEERLRDSVQFSLVVYESIAAYDVDLRDICRYIKELHATKESSDLVKR